MKVIIETKCGCRREFDTNMNRPLHTIQVPLIETINGGVLPTYKIKFRLFEHTGELTWSGLAGFEKYPLFREV
jgi:hypothetical protein